MDAVATLLIVLIIVLVISIVYTIYRIWKFKKEGPSHIEMYFDANFRTIIDEWDLVTRPRLKEWKTEMSRRLENVAKEIEYIEGERRSIDIRLDKIEKELSRIESF